MRRSEAYAGEAGLSGRTMHDTNRRLIAHCMEEEPLMQPAARLADMHVSLMVTRVMPISVGLSPRPARPRC